MGPHEKHQRFGGWKSKITYPTQSKHCIFYSEVIGLVKADYCVHVAHFEFILRPLGIYGSGRMDDDGMNWWNE